MYSLGISIVLFAIGLLGCSAQEIVASTVEQETKYLWPVTLWTVPFAADNGLESANLNAELAKIGEQMYDHFIKDILPKELQKNDKFREEFEEGDASRMNMAFVRWQRNVFSQKYRVPVDELFWYGEDLRKTPGVGYTWDAFYKSPLYVTLRRRIEQVVQAFVTFVEGEKPGKMRTFIWAEVYRHRDFHRPRVHTGAYCTGLLWVKFDEDKTGSAKLLIEDPRGVNPPYGKTHTVMPKEGTMNVWPSWASHFISPNMANSTNVAFYFHSMPVGGSPDFDWEDDPSGSYIFTKKSNINVKSPKGQGKAKGKPQGKEEL